MVGEIKFAAKKCAARGKYAKLTEIHFNGKTLLTTAYSALHLLCSYSASIIPIIIKYIQVSLCRHRMREKERT